MKTRILILGSGNAATRFGTAFRENGCIVTGVFSRTKSSAERLAAVLQAPALTEPGSLEPENADFVLSALSDAAADGVWKQIRFGKTPVLHTAGSLPMEALAPYAENRGVLYPLQTLSRSRVPDFRKIPLLIEANTPVLLRKVRILAELISDTVLEVDSASRKSLHLAAVFANNFSNYMFFLARKIAEKNGVPFEFLLPLIDETAEKVHEMSPRDAQTGPAIRGDSNIIGEQIRCLREGFPETPELAELYEFLSRCIHGSFGKKD